jgi:hypothetical protein
VGPLNKFYILTGLQPLPCFVLTKFAIADDANGYLTQPAMIWGPLLTPLREIRKDAATNGQQARPRSPLCPLKQKRGQSLPAFFV